MFSNLTEVKKKIGQKEKKIKAENNLKYIINDKCMSRKMAFFH